jgi:signal transduction histidine kinase
MLRPIFLDRPRNSRSLSIQIFAVAGFVILVMWIVVVSSVLRARHVALANARSEARNLTISFATELGHTLNRVGRAMQLVADKVRASNGDFDLTTIAQDIAVLGPTQATLIGSDGRLRSTTQVSNAGSIDLSDRPQFRVHLDDGRSTNLFIGPAVIGRLTHEYFIPVSKRIDGADGKLLGVLVFLLPPGSLTNLHQVMDLNPHDVIVLTGLDDIVCARFGSDSADGTNGIGRSLAGEPRPAAFSENSEGFYERPGLVDGIARIYAYRRVNAYPLVVTVGVDRNAVLAIPNSVARRMIIMATIGTFLLVCLVGNLVHEIGVRARHERALVEERRKLTELNDELADSKQRAEAASQAKSLFLANMSHELRTPLNAIIGFGEVIRDGLFGPVGERRYAEYAGDIAASGRHLLGIINGILDIAKIEAGKLMLDETHVCLANVVDSAMISVREEASRKKITLTTRYTGDLPEVRADARMLRQILINLLSNAVKFTPEHGRVEVSSERDGSGAVALAVCDTGIGMSHREVEAALEPFVQIENTITKTHAGTGLGLPLAKKFAEMHGASFEIDSFPGKGTTVRLRLPPERALSARPAFALA